MREMNQVSPHLIKTKSQRYSVRHRNSEKYEWGKHNNFSEEQEIFVNPHQLFTTQLISLAVSLIKDPGTLNSTIASRLSINFILPIYDRFR